MTFWKNTISTVEDFFYTSYNFHRVLVYSDDNGTFTKLTQQQVSDES